MVCGVTPVSIMASVSTKSGISLHASESECNCTIENLLTKSFGSRTFKEKIDIINKGRHTSDLKLKSKSSVGYNRDFNFMWYTEFYWLCGCTKLLKRCV